MKTHHILFLMLCFSLQTSSVFSERIIKSDQVIRDKSEHDREGRSPGQNIKIGLQFLGAPNEELHIYFSYQSPQGFYNNKNFNLVNEEIQFHHLLMSTDGTLVIRSGTKNLKSQCRVSDSYNVDSYYQNRVGVNLDRYDQVNNEKIIIIDCTNTEGLHTVNLDMSLKGSLISSEMDYDLEVFYPKDPSVRSYNVDEVDHLQSIQYDVNSQRHMRKFEIGIDNNDDTSISASYFQIQPFEGMSLAQLKDQCRITKSNNIRRIQSRKDALTYRILYTSSGDEVQFLMNCQKGLSTRLGFQVLDGSSSSEYTLYWRYINHPFPTVTAHYESLTAGETGYHHHFLQSGTVELVSLSANDEEINLDQCTIDNSFKLNGKTYANFDDVYKVGSGDYEYIIYIYCGEEKSIVPKVSVRGPAFNNQGYRFTLSKPRLDKRVGLLNEGVAPMAINPNNLTGWFSVTHSPSNASIITLRRNGSWGVPISYINSSCTVDGLPILLQANDRIIFDTSGLAPNSTAHIEIDCATVVFEPNLGEN